MRGTVRRDLPVVVVDRPRERLHDVPADPAPRHLAEEDLQHCLGVHPPLDHRAGGEQRVEVAGPATQRVDDLGVAPVRRVDRLERAPGLAETALGRMPHELRVEHLRAERQVIGHPGGVDLGVDEDAPDPGLGLVVERLERERGLAAAGRADDDDTGAVLAGDRGVRGVVHGMVTVARTADQHALPALGDAVAPDHRAVTHLRRGGQQRDAELVELLQPAERRDPADRRTVAVAGKDVVEQAVLQPLGSQHRGVERLGEEAFDPLAAVLELLRCRRGDREEQLALHPRERLAVLLVDEMVGPLHLVDQQRVDAGVCAVHVAGLVLEVGPDLLAAVAELLGRQQQAPPGDDHREVQPFEDPTPRTGLREPDRVRPPGRHERREVRGLVLAGVLVDDADLEPALVVGRPEVRRQLELVRTPRPPVDRGLVGDREVAEQTGPDDADEVPPQHRLDADPGVDGDRVDLVRTLVPLGDARGVEVLVVDSGRLVGDGRHRRRAATAAVTELADPHQEDHVVLRADPVLADCPARLAPDQLVVVVRGVPAAVDEVDDPAAEVRAPRHEHDLELRPVELPRDLVQEARQLECLRHELGAADVLVGRRLDEEPGPHRLAPDEDDVVAVAVRQALALGPRLAALARLARLVVVAADVEHEHHDRADADDAERDQGKEVQRVHPTDSSFAYGRISRSARRSRAASSARCHLGRTGRHRMTRQCTTSGSTSSARPWIRRGCRKR